MSEKFSINITGSTVGAFAVGSGAQASNVKGPADSSAKYSFHFDAKGATREQIARWLRTVAGVVSDPEHPVTSDAKAVDGASRAWNLEAE